MQLLPSSISDLSLAVTLLGLAWPEWDLSVHVKLHLFPQVPPDLTVALHLQWHVVICDCRISHCESLIELGCWVPNMLIFKKIFYFLKQLNSIEGNWKLSFLKLPLSLAVRALVLMAEMRPPIAIGYAAWVIWNVY